MQKQKIKELQDELRRTKATDAKRIAELKAEIATLRKLLAHYIQQIDSLNSLNQRLTSENLEVKQRYQHVSAEAEQLAKERESLTETVTRAAILEAYNITVVPLDGRERKTERAARMRTLKFNFTIGKNITAAPGMKTVYMRLTRPDDELMTKDGGTFPYENGQIGYSIKKEIEYSGEAYSDVLYWKVDEILQLGTYRVDFLPTVTELEAKHSGLKKIRRDSATENSIKELLKKHIPNKKIIKFAQNNLFRNKQSTFF